MRSVHLLLASAALMVTTSAQGADELKFGKAPAWVVAQPIPTSPAASADAPVAVLLSDQQVQLQPGKVATFSELAIKIQKPEGLSAGNVSIPWDPATDTLTVNKLEIHRGGQVIDVLAGGQKFTTMRRESGLEAAMLDGNLTANIQPEGLQEGDVLDLAMTVEHADPIMNGHVESNFAVGTKIQVKRSHLKVEWPASLKINVQAKGLAIQPVARGATKVVEVTSENLEPIIPPKGAPGRFTIARFGEATDFGSWADVARLMDPLFRKAEAIPSAGPLHDEVEKIRAASSDPTKRAAAALQLVQDRVRYVALLMGQGSYLPASAEETWSRRFGDCKAKTALLLGILHSLNIEAEPLLVQSTIGDAIAERLPLLSYFDHVLVRAHIDGKPYYLDGTRTGDIRLADIEVPYFGWGLPVLNDAKLVALVPPARTIPDHERTVEVDATAGIYANAPITLTEIYRGDSAIQVNAIYAALSSAQRDEVYRKNANAYFDGFQLTSSSTQFDKANREIQTTIKGTAKLNWRNGWFYVPTSSIAFTPDYARPAGPNHDAPIDVGYPSFAKDTANLKLPPGFAKRQKLEAPVHETLAGVEYLRAETVAGDSLTVVSSERSLVPEVPYKDALAAASRLKALNDDDIYLKLPADYRATTADLPALKSDPAGSASDLVTRGNTLMEGGNFDDAIANFDKALELDPENIYALSDRAIALVWTRKFDLADKDLATALALEPDNPVALRARGLKAEIGGNCKAAVDDYTASIRKEASQFALVHRAICENNSGLYAEAFADTETALKEAPKSSELRLLRVEILARQGQADAAAREADFFVRENADLPAAAWIAVARVLAKAGIRDRAVAAFDRAIAVKPEPSLYVSKAEIRSVLDFDGRMADLNAALKLEPLDSGALAAKADLLARHGDLNAALAVYDRAIRAIPGQSPLTLGRAILIYKMGRKAEAQRNITIWRRGALTSSELNNLCWDKAIAGILLESAVQDCRDALKLNPDHGSYFDSLGMALLKLGKLDDALTAYDKAVAKGTGAGSLMGRAIVYARKGDRTHSEADATAARKLDPDIDTVFEQYGLKL